MANNRYQATNTFSGGMNSDADKSLVGKNQYLYAENFRLFGDSANSIGSLENVIGNTELTTLNSYIPSGYYICGSGNIRDDLYLCVTQNTSAGQTGYSKVLKVVFNSTGTAVSSVTTVYNDQFSIDGSRLKWNNLPAYRVKIVGRYESATIQKLYFVDGYNPVRSMNVVSVSSTSPVNKFDLIPNFNISAPAFSSFGTGVLTSGRIQYAYQMYDLNGAETLFSPTSSLISISTFSGQTGSNKTFKGSDVDINTNKGIRISILPPSGFSRIRVVSIKYRSLNSVPVISIIADQNISTTPSTTYFYDTGVSNLGSYTYEEFAVVGRGVFIGSEIEEKNNYLFVGNTVDESWDVDFDARAYRFVSSTATGTLTSGHAAIFDSGTWGANNWYNIYNNYKIGGTTEVPDTYDCLNPYNDISLDTQQRRDNSPGYVHLYNFKYKVDGTTLGGSGKYVSYTFRQDHEIPISDTGTNYGEDFCYNTDYSNATVEVTYTGYQRDEIYRFGLIFYDEKGRQSTVKWIGDIRMPYYGDAYSPDEEYEIGPSNWAPSFVSGTTIYARPLGIIFTVDTTTAYSQGARYFKIVRAERKVGDRNILAQGLTPTTILYNDGSGLSYRGFVIPYTGTTTVGGITKQPTVLEFISPEINFNKNLEVNTSSDTIEYIGYGTNQYQYDNFSKSSVTVGTLPSGTNYSHTMKYGGLTTAVSSARYTKITPLTSGLIFGVPTKTVNYTYLDGVNLTGVTYKVLNGVETTMTGSGSSSHFAIGGTKLILKTTNSISNFSTSSYASFYCNYKRSVFNSQYGGNTYAARQFTPYIDCGLVQTCYHPGTLYPYTYVFNVYGGDTYIDMFDYLRNIVTGDVPTTRRTQVIMYFPVETSINLRYREDDCFSKTVDTTNHDKVLLQEIAGSYVSILVPGTNISYTQLTDLYKYNSVYSQPNNTLSYFPKSSLITTGDVIHDNRVMVSDLKINGEAVDSWTIFKLDNFLDVDSRYGKITTLLHKDNYLYFWQPKAFGVLSVAQRSLVQDNNQGQLVIGTGGILDRYDYISTSEGCSTRFSVVQGLRGLYWFDNNNSGFYRYGGNGVQSLSITKGINNLTKKSITLERESISGFDKLYNEVLFSLPTAETTLVFNEIFDSFNAVYTFDANLFIKANGSINILSTNRDSKDYLYMHNTGARTNFYGSDYQPLIRFIVNDHYDKTKVFDGLQFQSVSIDSSNINQIYDTFGVIRVYNDWQNSDTQNIYTSGPYKNINRPEREFILNIPRNIVDVDPTSNPDIFSVINLDSSKLFKERMRDKYIIVELYYTTSSEDNYSFSVPYITTNYRISRSQQQI